MSQALYRKYRPKSLDKLVGQEHVTKTLANALKEGHISHAYLLTGPRGSGKTSIARILAREINKLPYDNESPHLDIIEIDAASNNGVEDVRDLREKVLLAPTSATYKVYIIDEVHMLSNAAFNALLKTLEEPPAHAVFILATTEIHKLPATIISRTQRFQFLPVPVATVVAHLKYIADQEGIKIDDEALQLIAQHGDGAFRDSISLLDQLRSVTNDKITTETIEATLGLAPHAALTQLLDAVTSGNVHQVISQLEALLQKGLSAPALSQQLIGLCQTRGSKQPQLYRLIDALIEVPRAYSPKLKLEVVLVEGTLALAAGEPSSGRTLGFGPSNGGSSPSTPARKGPTPTKPQKTDTKPSPTAKTTSIQTTDKAPTVATLDVAAEETQIVHLADVTDAQWQAIVAAAKVDGPTLYTIARQAMPHFDVEKQLLTLTFRFPLHQKRLDEAKYKQAFGKILHTVLGTIPSLQTVVNKNAVRNVTAVAPAKTDAEQALPEDAATNNVMNLMGGGEVVNV